MGHLLRTEGTFYGKTKVLDSLEQEIELTAVNTPFVILRGEIGAWLRIVYS